MYDRKELTVENTKLGTWEYYSSTMMKCSDCGRTVPRHRYKFCPHCGLPKQTANKPKSDIEESWEQLSLF